MFYTCVLIKLSLISCVVGIYVVESERILTDLEGEINGTLKKLESINILDMLIAYIDGKLESSNQKTLDIEQKITETVKTLDKMEKELLENKQISQHLYCKERVVLAVGLYNYNHQMNPIETLNHVTLRRNDFGVTDFKMYVAIKAARDGIILLSSKPNPRPNDLVFEIVVGGVDNSKTFLRLNVDSNQNTTLSATPNILNATHFKTFQIKISDGILELSEAGNSTPLLTYHHDDVKSVKYISFTTWGKNEATFRYDCPGSVY